MRIGKLLETHRFSLRVDFSGVVISHIISKNTDILNIHGSYIEGVIFRLITVDLVEMGNGGFSAVNLQISSQRM